MLDDRCEYDNEHDPVKDMEGVIRGHSQKKLTTVSVIVTLRGGGGLRL